MNTMSDPGVPSDADRTADNAPIEHYLSELNPMQREAAETLDGPVLVLAGAGTGKTRALTTRLANLLASDAARPWSVLAVTFTNRAAQEMRARVAAMTGDAVEQIWLGTFHAMGARMLRSNADCVGLKSNFTILDADDQVRLVKQVTDGMDFDPKMWPARYLNGVIQRWKDRALRPDDISEDDPDFHSANKQMKDIYKLYQERLRTLNAADFGDLLLHCLILLRDYPEILQRYHRRFSHILVDEYQDTNVVQYLWLRLLAQEHRNICCVGDDDQSIYGWRGAEVRNILKFESDFPGAAVIRLEQNYRSTSRVLATASGLIAHNKGRLGKTLWTDGNLGEKIILRATYDGRDEARKIVDQIERRSRENVPLREIAVLVRTGAQTREIEESFLDRAIPYQLIGGARFYERMEIRDAIAYLRVLHQPEDDLALERIINKPRRGIGRASLQPLQRYVRTETVSLWTAMTRLLETDQLRSAARRALAGMIGDFNRWRKLEPNRTTAGLVRLVLEESGYIAMLEADRSPEAPGRLENLEELINAAGEFESAGAFLEHVSLVMENTDSGVSDQVSIMTMHAAKGLEFDIVFLPGWEDGLFPNSRAIDEDEINGLEEERRLAYVALTRARRIVEVSFAATRFYYTGHRHAFPSRFVVELPAKHIKPVDVPRRLWDMMLRQSELKPDLDPAAVPIAAAPRSQPRYQRRDGILPGNRPTPGAGEPAADFAVGDRVFHQKLGMGTVTLVDGTVLSITFDHAGPKRVVASFVARP